MSRSEVWFIRPRDPLVLGDGRGPVAGVTGRAFPLPLPQTVAGMVRAQFLRDAHDIPREQALSVLRQVQVEGPWLWDESRSEPWVFAPADATRDQEGEGETIQGQGPQRQYRLYRDEIVSVDEAAGEGVLWPRGAPPLQALLVPQARVAERKTRPAGPFWPLGDAIDWALHRGRPTHDPGAEEPVLGEPRVHVALDDGTGTADPGMLFSSAGGRFRDGFGLLLRVTAPAEWAGSADGPSWPGEQDVVVLGGEARPSFRSKIPDAAYPAMDSYRRHYEHLAEVRGTVGLRLQLLTHACLYGPVAEASMLAWLPSWLDRDGHGSHPLLPDVPLRLRAVRMERPVAVSGWDLQGGGRREGAPRKLRRLVAAGTVYYFTLPRGSGQECLAACEALFARPLDPAGTGDEAQHQAAAQSDGMGLCLPGLLEMPR